MKRKICFVGISGKPGVKKPLSDRTLSGKIISKVEAKLSSVSKNNLFFHDNLVRYAPMTAGKLRYPSPQEIQAEWRSFERRLSKTKSDIVILLGALVAKSFKERKGVSMLVLPDKDKRLLKWAGTDENGRLILAAAHPSYVGIYARKQLGDYARIISQAINHNHVA